MAGWQSGVASAPDLQFSPELAVLLLLWFGSMSQQFPSIRLRLLCFLLIVSSKNELMSRTLSLSFPSSLSSFQYIHMHIYQIHLNTFNRTVLKCKDCHLLQICPELYLYAQDLIRWMSLLKTFFSLKWYNLRIRPTESIGILRSSIFSKFSH